MTFSSSRPIVRGCKRFSSSPIPNKQTIRTMVADLETTKATHFNDWPNAVGLDVHYEERTPVQLRVEGTIPSYVSGTLFRTGLGPRTIKTNKNSHFKVNHWFDHFSQVHRFQIDSNGTVAYNSRLTTDGLIEKARKVTLPCNMLQRP